jgi:hypothetical protein
MKEHGNHLVSHTSLTAKGKVWFKNHLGEALQGKGD